MIDVAILRAMAAAGATVEMILAAIEAAQAAAAEKIEARRKKDALRKQKSRAVHDGHAMSHAVPRTECDTPPAYTTPPKEIKPKKVLSTKQTFPTDFALAEPDWQLCREQGWHDEKTSMELKRFRDHAAATGRKLADWHAGWRQWVRSPYQNPPPQPPRGTSHVKNCSDVARELVREFSGPAGGNSDRVLPEVGRERSGDLYPGRDGDPGPLSGLGGDGRY